MSQPGKNPLQVWTALGILIVAVVILWPRHEISPAPAKPIGVRRDRTADAREGSVPYLVRTVPAEVPFTLDTVTWNWGRRPGTARGTNDSAQAVLDQSALAALTGDEAPEDPLARIALSLVGVDPAAEEYWIEAINDPDLSPEERANLIEDLNEEGLSDPEHPSPDDLAIILHRIQLVEELAEMPLDEVNAAAFEEAYLDLVNLAEE